MSDIDSFGIPTEAAQPQADWEWECEVKGQPALAAFKVLSKGQRGTSTAHGANLDTGELPEVSLVSVHNMDGTPIQLSKSEQEDLEQRAAEAYYAELYEHGGGMGSLMLRDRQKNYTKLQGYEESVDKFGVPLMEKIGDPDKYKGWENVGAVHAVETLYNSEKQFREAESILQHGGKDKLVRFIMKRFMTDKAAAEEVADDFIQHHASKK